MTASVHVFPGWKQPSLKWFRVQIPHPLRESIEDLSRAYDSPAEQLRVIVSWSAQLGWHLSISHPKRYPTWDEIRDTRYDLLPDACTMGMLLPPKADYVNVHPNCFHLHEVRDA